MRRDRARALLSAGRSVGRGCDQGPRGTVLLCAARQSRASRVGRHAGRGGDCDRGAGGDGEALPAPARAQSALSIAGADQGSGDDVWAAAVGALLAIFVMAGLVPAMNVFISWVEGRTCPAQ